MPTIKRPPKTENPAPVANAANGPIGREGLLSAAVQQFAKAGYDATTMRDIAALSGMKAGSMYYHFDSKETLFVAVHQYAIEHICDSVRRCIDSKADPWTRLTQAAQGYLESMLKEPEYASIIIAEFPRKRSPELRKILISHRQMFETIFAQVIEELPLKRGTDRRYLRLGLLGMLAWTYTWYRPDGPDSPKVIARKLVTLLREPTP